MKSILIGLACFLFGLTWDITYRLPYYEIRGCLIIQQELLGIEFVYSWADEGFRDMHPDEWDLRRMMDEPNKWIPRYGGLE